MRRRRREHKHRRGLWWLSQAAGARARLLALPGEGLDDFELKLMVGHWRGELDDAAWQLGTLSVLPAMRRPLLQAVRTHGPQSTATLTNAGARFAGRALTAEEISFLVAGAVDAELLVSRGENAGFPRWQLTAAGSRAAGAGRRWRR